MQYQKFDKPTLKALRAEMNAVLEKYGVDSNLDIEVGNMRFSDAKVDITVTAKIKGKKTREDIMLDMEIEHLNIMKEKNGRRLVEYRTRNHKYPFIYEEIKSGKLFKCSKAQAMTYFHKAG